jgi:branched-chain amino acid transport system ATP-binding protein
MMSDKILEIKNLSLSYGGIEAVKNVSFDVERGEIVTLIGANGAGKSTILKTLAGLLRPKNASILFEGQEMVGKTPDAIVKCGITLVPEGRRVFPNLTVKENLKIGAYLRKDNLDKDIEYVYGLFPRLREREWQLAGTLSGGEQQMLAVGRALMSKPKFIMMDEPSLGLAPLVVKDIFSIIKTINEQGITVLLIEQNANMALQVAHRAYVLETGTLTLSGTGAELLADPKIREAYLGKSKNQ